MHRAEVRPGRHGGACRATYFARVVLLVFLHTLIQEDARQAGQWPRARHSAIEGAREISVEQLRREGVPRAPRGVPPRRPAPPGCGPAGTGVTSFWEAVAGGCCFFRSP